MLNVFSNPFFGLCPPHHNRGRFRIRVHPPLPPPISSRPYCFILTISQLASNLPLSSYFPLTANVFQESFSRFSPHQRRPDYFPHGVSFRCAVPLTAEPYCLAFYSFEMGFALFPQPMILHFPQNPFFLFAPPDQCSTSPSPSTLSVATLLFSDHGSPSF